MAHPVEAQTARRLRLQQLLNHVILVQFSSGICQCSLSCAVEYAVDILTELERDRQVSF